MCIMCLTWNACEYLHYYLCTVQLRRDALLLACKSSSVCVVLSSVISHRWLPNICICSTSDLIRCDEYSVHSKCELRVTKCFLHTFSVVTIMHNVY